MKNYYNKETAKNTDNPDILTKILEQNNNDIVSECAARNPNCPAEVLKMVLERNKDDIVSEFAARNPNCPAETLQMVLERNKDDYVSRCAALNPNCPAEALKMVLERNKDDYVSGNAANNKNCPVEAKFNWLRNTGKITKEDPNKHIIEYEQKDDSQLDKFRQLLSN